MLSTFGKESNDVIFEDWKHLDADPKPDFEGRKLRSEGCFKQFGDLKTS